MERKKAFSAYAAGFLLLGLVGTGALWLQLSVLFSWHVPDPWASLACLGTAGAWLAAFLGLLRRAFRKIKYGRPVIGRALLAAAAAVLAVLPTALLRCAARALGW